MTGQIDIESIDAMRDLIDGMQTTGAQGQGLVDYATTAVTQKDGFEPSTVCALQPFARAMEAMDTAFTRAFATFASRWSGMTEGVGYAVIDFQRTEGRVVDDIDDLLHRTERRSTGPVIAR